MKKLLALLLLTLSTFSFAGQTISVFWPHGVGDASANYMRALLAQANENQKDYTFIFSPAPGAGGSIAVNKAVSTENSILGASSAFFIRPNLYPTSSHDVTKFRIVVPMAVTPFALITTKGRSMDDLRSKSVIFFGAGGGLGSTTHVISQQLYMPNLIVVPYPSLGAATQDMYGGRIDITLDYLIAAHNNPNVNILGVTGTRKIEGYNPLPYTSQLSIPNFIAAPVSMKEEMFKEIQQVLIESNKNNQALDLLYKNNFATRIEIPKSEYDRWYLNNIDLYKGLTKNVKVD